jgi:hypothetical protein
MGVFVEINAGEGGQLGSAIAQLDNVFYTPIFACVL